MTGKKSKLRIFFIILIIASIFFLMQGSVLAETPQFRLDIDSLNLEKGVSTNLVLLLVNAKGAKVVDIKGLENFDIVSKSNATTTQIINGDMTYEKRFNYVIIPKNIGEFILQGSVEYNGVTYQTNKLKVNVSKASASKKEEVKDLFVKTILSNDTIYFGQKVALSYKLYSRYNIESFGFADSPNIKDFISNDIPEDKLKANYIYLDGNKYVEYEAKQMLLSPIKTGTFTIPEYNFQVNVSTGDFFNSSKPVYLQTDAKELKVKPLPQENRPKDFSGIVGKLNLEAKYNKHEIDYGDSLTLSITAFGNCNLDDLNKIVKDDIPGFSVYETEKNMEEGIENNQYKAKKEFEVILVPEQNGDISIDPIYIYYFNPETGSYEQAKIPGTTITVNGEVPKLQTDAKNEASEVETIKIEQVSYKPLNEEYLTIQIKKQNLIIVLVLFAFLLIVATIFFLIILYRRKGNKELEVIYKQIKTTNNQNKIYNLFNDMIKHSFNISLKASSRNDIANCLEGHKITQPVLEIMDYMENEKYYDDKGEKYLKDKIKEIYRMIKYKN
ncbi:BatD family protein [Paramaledivibacter caminithermalis]|uniref:Oxygen tolerance n=1 Tax=Paramaledivibacter caminithermalis (strain DSM 15212 / CIP 107654 / DViRD3) TaxID=1121301 RepID=A0A1M6MDS2_PARC5|nr:BatD family protein [Paramaledivibacter caminithermalis]SHJ81595.1 Oxygen tolerance [Paramaledivibacter caminithermalis DSM 15212]